MKKTENAKYNEQFTRVDRHMPKLVLYCTSGKNIKGISFRVDKVPFCIGRGAINGIMLDREDRMPASRHVMIHCKDEEWIMDVWGTNGMVIDGESVPRSSQVVLHDGMDLLIYGNQEDARFTVSIQKKNGIWLTVMSWLKSKMAKHMA